MRDAEGSPGIFTIISSKNVKEIGFKKNILQIYIFCASLQILYRDSDIRGKINKLNRIYILDGIKSSYNNKYLRFRLERRKKQLQF